jgi:hypothetical protein
MSYVIQGLDPAPFQPLFGASADALAAVGAIRVMADREPGFPCRVTLRDARPGESLLLVNHEHQSAATPYRSCHAIFVLEGAGTPARYEGEVPLQLRRRLISLRAFDAAGMMVEADAAEGDALEPMILRLLADPGVAYLHAHNAKPGCFAARIDRT